MTSSELLQPLYARRNSLQFYFLSIRGTSEHNHHHQQQHHDHHDLDDHHHAQHCRRFVSFSIRILLRYLQRPLYKTLMTLQFSLVKMFDVFMSPRSTCILSIFMQRILIPPCGMDWSAARSYQDLFLTFEYPLAERPGQPLARSRTFFLHVCISAGSRGQTRALRVVLQAGTTAEVK